MGHEDTGEKAGESQESTGIGLRESRSGAVHL